jgi:hypothetical protein
MPVERGMPQDVKKHFATLRLLLLGSLLSLSGVDCVTTGNWPKRKTRRRHSPPKERKDESRDIGPWENIHIFKPENT